MSADDGGIRATQDKERGREVPTGCWEGEGIFRAGHLKETL